MKFIVGHHAVGYDLDANTFYIRTDNWDDWGKYGTLYRVTYIDKNKNHQRIGEVKIGQFGMKDGQRKPAIPDNFETLTEDFFSLGQDDSYYQKLNDLGSDVRDKFLNSLNDIAKNKEIFDKALLEDVTRTSLLRDVARSVAEGQYRRMANGGVRLTPYNFTYTPPAKNADAPVFKFNIEPDSSPPTNIQVIIGRNGVGKTHAVTSLIKTLFNATDNQGDVNWEESSYDSNEEPSFSNVVFVAFSSFDNFNPCIIYDNENLKFHYVGIKSCKKNNDNPEIKMEPKSNIDLENDFSKNIKIIVKTEEKRERFIKAINILESDELFKKAEIIHIFYEYDFLEDDNEIIKTAIKIFSKMSSGHKIILLTITKLIVHLQEKSLVIMDEPESHLHPPLLSAFIRALSDLLIDRNAVAIIATHSPVILQEVPKKCVWRIQRTGHITKINRPRIETFGENVGTLTHEIFRLEVTNSGFYKLISDMVDKGGDYDSIIESFGNQLGDEARAIIHSLIATRQAEEEL